ncbi:hypothetical protein NHX12_024313 [Muraenolepis orangiensis]|uniref:Uncharacterized protein n=1 Tax=Muraenolepis orangiensis TaxID=630683 RepID=A0A9Q0ENX0_9TELE|nr:hypothetical protein NHX12_024313 [Muraenolepis orangiensis]
MDPGETGPRVIGPRRDWSWSGTGPGETGSGVKWTQERLVLEWYRPRRDWFWSEMDPGETGARVKWTQERLVLE